MEIDKFRLEAMLKFRHYINESERQRAGGPSPRMPVFFPQNEKNVCYVQGIFNSKVTDILPQSNRPCEQYYCGTLTKKTLFTDYIQKKLMPWYIRCRHYALSTRTGHKTLQQSFYQLLVQGRDIEKLSLELESDLFPVFNTLLNRAYTQSMKTSQPLPMFEDLYLDDVVHDLAPFLTPNMLPIEIDPWRRLGVTQEGRMAWLPELTEVGDEVWLVKGAPFPFVFRNIGRGYKALVGDAYLHEAQNGEVWPKDERGLQGIKIV
ncbi:heterokaryon incompatibility protein (het-6OR allele) [Teratosphaeria destructans]|uniref:Heterokaryon incompatibility protein (Het-6OR allele) n=1 Tax=Teratosphaeria destructans TaxID=418781 RepID=A0A9W7SXY4_9PEZI|nr:heterokaryon incompatibility protein (het-6OR allele) [Teratosphaeria destructans]